MRVCAFDYRGSVPPGPELVGPVISYPTISPVIESGSNALTLATFTELLRAFNDSTSKFHSPTSS